MEETSSCQVNSPCKMHLWTSSPLLLVPKHICICIQTCFQWGLLYSYCGFFMTAILFNVAPEELCSVFQSSKYKSSLNLSPKCSYCCQKRILEECGPDFHSLIWTLRIMFYSIPLPLPPARLSWCSFCSISYSGRTNEF